MKKTVKRVPAVAAPAKPAFNSDRITIEDFKIVSGFLDASGDFEPKMIETYEVNYAFDMGFYLAGNKVRSVLIIEVKTKSTPSQSEAKGKFELHYHFNVEHLKELAIAGKNEMIDVSPDLANAIASITYSTSRGILLARMQNTAFEQFILPVVSPNELVRRGAKK